MAIEIRSLLDMPDHRITAHLRKRPASTLVVCFNEAREGLGDHAFGTDLVLEAGCDAVAVTETGDTFFQRLSLTAFAGAIAPLGGRYDRVFTFGAGLGGYAALFFAPAVEGTAIAFAPRLVLHPAHAPFRDGDPPRQPMLHPGLDRSSSPGLRPIVMIDPRHEADAVFANTIVRPAYPETRIVELQGAGHRVAKLLAYQGLLKPVVRAILATNEVPAIPFDARNRPRRHLTLAIEAMTQGDMVRAGTLLRRVAADPGVTGFAEARALWEDTTGRKLQGRPAGRKARTGPAA